VQNPTWQGTCIDKGGLVYFLRASVVASHLTVTSKPPTGAPASKPFGNPNGAEADNGTSDTFAALLGGASQAISGPTAGKKSEQNADKIVDLLQGLGEGTGDAEDPDAIAALTDGTQTVQTTAETKALLTDLINDLASLKQALDAGETLDPELLADINTALDGLAEQLGLDLSAIPDLAALTAADQTDAAAQLTNALVPLAQTLLGGEAAPSASAELSAQIKAIGDKLAALLQALNNDALSTDKLAALGLGKAASFDADLEAALAKLLNATPKLASTADATILATPTLKLTEPVLTGKADPGAIGTPAQPAASADSSTTGSGSRTTGDTGDAAIKLAATGGNADKPDGQPADSNKHDNKPLAAPATPSDARTEAPAMTATAPQAARVDAVAPRVIQAGYQTSQQQLNLPQLAFELVRQVTDGNTRFQLRLDPAELGRIDVRLDIDKSGQINARLVVEKSETLDLMQRDQRALEKALQQAGLDSSKTNLEFSLKQSPFSGGQQQGRDDQGQQFSLNGNGADDLDEAPPIINLYRGSLTASGVNIIA